MVNCLNLKKPSNKHLYLHNVCVQMYAYLFEVTVDVGVFTHCIAIVYS